MVKTYSFAKSLVLNLLILVVVLIVMAYPTGTVQAADFPVNTAADLNNAIVAANNETDNPGADTIVLSADITLTGTLSTITSEITIVGNGYVLDGNSSYRVLNVTSAGNLTVDQLTISNGLATDGGGAGILNGGLLTVNNSTLLSNSATTTNPFGGAIYNNNGAVIINSSTFTNNSAGSGGAIRNSGTMTINNSTISGNSVGGGFGGGITNSAGVTLTINNTTITNNIAGPNRGGGIRNDGTTHINRCIVSGNSAAISTAEISNIPGATINANNYNIFAHSGLNDEQAYTNFTPGANDINATSDGDPTELTIILDTTLANNGGPTLTHALLSTSPAIDLAPSADCTAAPVNSIDQRGATRNFDGNDTVSGECDIGAYELHEIVNVGNCAGPAFLDGPQTIFFTSGYSVTVNVDTSDGINCISIEEMGANHPMATVSDTGDNALLTGNWWHITGNINSGFSIDITLFYPGADENSRVCKWPGTFPGYGWDCGTAADNSPGPGPNNVTRTGIGSFSDWAVGDNVGPTAVTVSSMNTQTAQPLVSAILALVIICFGGFIIIKKFNQQKI